MRKQWFSSKKESEREAVGLTDRSSASRNQIYHEANRRLAGLSRAPCPKGFSATTLMHYL